MKNLFRSRLITPLVLIALAPSAVYANVTMEYYTYGGFGPITSALNKISLIFAAGAYQGLFFSAAVLGLFMGGMMVMMKSLSGSKGSIGGWAFSVVTGVVLYLALIVPKGSLVVYDPVMNQTQTIANIPDGVVMIAGMLNKVERGMVELVSNTADPVGYQVAAGGSNFDILNNLSSKGVLLTDQYLNTSLQNYVTDCVFFEMQRPGTTLDMNVLSNNADFMPIFQQAASPAIYTTYYDSANESGFSETCSVAWTDIQTAINDPTQYTSSIASRCADAGYDPTIPSELTACQSAISNTVNWLEASSYSATDVFRQFLIAQTVSNAAISASPDTAMQMLATKNAATGMMGTAVMANQWIPVIKALMVSVAFCMVPLLALFVPTPIFPKALGAMVGFFLWITVWGIIDAILHQFAIDYASTVAAQIKQYQLGVTAVMNFSTFATKTLAAFGMVRWAGLMLSTALVGMLIKFGGAAMAGLSSSVTGHVQASGSQAGHQIITPEGKAQTLRGLQDAPGVMANAHRWDYGTRAEAGTFDQMSRMGTSINTQRALGGGVQQPADRMADAGMKENVQKVGGAERFRGSQEAMDYAGRNKSQDIGRSAQSEQIANSLYQGGKLEHASNDQKMRAMGEFFNSGRVTENELPALAKATGMSQEAARKELLGATINPNSIGVDQNTGGLMLKNFEAVNGDKAIKYHDGMISETGTMTGSQILDKASALQKQGHPEAAAGLRSMVSPQATGSDGKHGTAGHGRGMLSDEVMKYSEDRSVGGNHGVFKSEHGAAVEWKDTSRDDQYRKEDHLTQKMSGVDKQQVDNDVIRSNKGTEIATSTALQRVLNKDNSLVSGLTRAHTEEGKRAQIAAIVSSLGAAIAPFESRTGISMDSSEASARMSAGAGTPGFSPVKASIDGSAGVSGQRVDSKQTNLVNQQLEQTLYKADKEAAAKGYKGKEADTYVMDKLHGHVHNMAEEHIRNNPDKFGASAGPTYVKEKANAMLNKIKGE